jgi:hypothetical protein
MLAHYPLLSRRRFMTLFGWVALTPLVASACRGDDDRTPTLPAATSTEPPDPRTPTLAPAPTNTPAASSTSRPASAGPVDEELPVPVKLTIQFAAREHDTPLSDVTLVSFTERDWPSPALGCPEEGRLYPQIVTPGYVVVVMVERVQVEYHTDSRASVTSCRELP